MIILPKKRAISKKDKEVLFSLFQEYQQDIFRMAYTYVKNNEDALDVVQEVAYRALKKIDTLNEPQYFKTWLFRITINCSIDWLKKNNKLVMDSNDLDSYCDDSIQHLDMPLSLSLQDILDELDVTEKTVILLKYYQEFTFQEISAFMTLPLSTVKTITYRALKKLKTKIKREDLYGG
ncbi:MULTISPECIES: RNA polymerase sigma factor [Rummeliibacillus]|jgi:RNA polymerase sigma-70 factor (ECF subfamily)|uniref:RNA polymerase sigma factor n=1 Tax=Rummeliibacillus TaxID=648802 RepID=UPI0011B65A68|nr:MULTISPECIES: sigma-70 family RNA polymerase sigma factor [Rummeliibacillus]MBO2537378.1 sigma-70 family RNA polymerase sigma factor [Rummeliibacillus suwonensis]